jgi:hypothetical protein
MKEPTLLEQVLLDLGDSADTVARTLQEHGVKGVRNTVRYLNPIVRFAQSRLRLDDYRLDVAHGDGMPTYILRMTLPNGAEESVRFPEAVKDFLDAFNSGKHAELEL